MQILKDIYMFIYYEIPYGLRNLITFFPVIWKYRSYDFIHTLDFLRYGLRHLKKGIEMGGESDKTRLPKIESIQRSLTILDHIVNFQYIVLTEKALGEWPILEGNTLDEHRPVELQERSKQMRAYHDQLEEKEWKELWEIISGSESIPGSDIRGWWD